MFYEKEIDFFDDDMLLFDKQEIQEYFMYFIKNLEKDKQHTILIRIVNFASLKYPDINDYLTLLIEKDNYKYGQILFYLLDHFILVCTELCEIEEIHENIKLTHAKFSSMKSLKYERNLVDLNTDIRAINCDYSAVDVFMEYLTKKILPIRNTRSKKMFMRTQSHEEIVFKNNNRFSEKSPLLSSSAVENKTSKYISYRKNKNDDDDDESM